MLLFRNSFLLVSVFLLGMCGFHPLCQKEDVVEKFSKIKIRPIEGKLGQTFRNILLEKLTPRGVPQSPEYILEVSLTTSDRDLGIAKDATTTRSEVTVVVSYTLKEARTGKVLHTGKESESSDYDVLTDSYYSNIVSKEDTREGLVALIADLVHLSLASYLSSEKVP